MALFNLQFYSFNYRLMIVFVQPVNAVLTLKLLSPCEEVHYATASPIRDVISYPQPGLRPCEMGVLSLWPESDSGRPVLHSLRLYNGDSWHSSLANQNLVYARLHRGRFL
jgi:hypothetical protein